MERLRRDTKSNFNAGQDWQVPDEWKCSECGKRAGYFNFNSRVCSEECARVRKSRLQRERRHAKGGKRVLVKFRASYTGSQG
jgi:rubredoxin